jgi:hypothetical protein
MATYVSGQSLAVDGGLAVYYQGAMVMLLGLLMVRESPKVKMLILGI